MDSTITPAVILSNLPAQALGGIDLLSFTTTPRFRGIKNIPLGLHFVFTGATTTLSIRHGVWFEIVPSPAHSQPQLLVKKWENETETLVQETTESEILRYRANLGSIWREGLAPYRQTASRDAPDTSKNGGSDDISVESNAWPSLSSHITASLLTRILGNTPSHWSLTSSSSAACDVDEIPGLSTSEVNSALAEKDLNFLPVDLKQTWREGATGRERTDAAQDRSWYLSSLITAHCTSTTNPSEEGEAYTQVLAELEFTFLMVLTLNNYSCLQQWRRLLSLILTCKTAVTSYPTFFSTTLRILRLQLQHAADADGGSDSTGLFDFADEDATFLKVLLVRFRRGVESLPSANTSITDTKSAVASTETPGQIPSTDTVQSSQSTDLLSVLDELDELEEWLREAHGWRFEEQSMLARHGTLELMDGERVEMDAGGFDAEDESGEYAPVVVDLTPEQMRLLGVEVGDQDLARLRSSAGGRHGEEGIVSGARRLRLGSLGGDGGLTDEIEDSDAEDGIEQEEEDDEQEDMDLEDMDARY